MLEERCYSVLHYFMGNLVHAPGTQPLGNTTQDLMCAFHMHMHSLQGVTGVAVSQRRLLGYAQMYLTDLYVLLREVI